MNLYDEQHDWESCARPYAVLYWKLHVPDTCLHKECVSHTIYDGRASWLSEKYKPS